MRFLVVVAAVALVVAVLAGVSGAAVRKLSFTAAARGGDQVSLTRRGVAEGALHDQGRLRHHGVACEGAGREDGHAYHLVVEGRLLDTRGQLAGHGRLR